VRVSAICFFDRLRRVESVEGLAGLADLPSIFRPVQFTLIPDSVQNLHDVACALRHCDHICTLLEYQDDTIKNTYALRASLIQYLFISVLPVPVPMGHLNEKKCLWRQPMRFETQVDLLRSIWIVSRHFAAVCMSLKVTKSFDASRILTVASMASIVDVIIRQRATDIPSMFSLHLCGNAPPTPRFFFQPFGFDMGPFAAQSQFMKFSTPELVVARTKVIDYFTSQANLVVPDHRIFCFESSHALGNLEALLRQLCWEIGFPEPDLALYVTGEKTEILDSFPEFLYYRDVVFMFKFMMSPTSDALPEIRPWHVVDARLNWSFSPENGFVVRAFQRSLRCTIPALEGDFSKRQRDAPRGMLSWFRSFQPTRAGPSGADPTALTGKQVNSEEDVLHITSLPDFGGRLSQRNSELLISYLTVPYIRIPLILHFFSGPENISSLASKELQDVLEAVVFEPELFEFADQETVWNLADLEDLPLPFNDRKPLATPCGLLYNEILKSPNALFESISSFLEQALERDIGRYTESSQNLILFIIRFVVRFESFLSFLIRHREWKKQSVDFCVVNKSGCESYIRGLDCDEETYAFIKRARSELRNTLNTRVFYMLQVWLDHATQVGEINQACTIHAHLSVLFSHLPPEELNSTNVLTLLSSVIFLNTRHIFSVSAECGDKIKRSEKDILTAELGISDVELFDLFQRQRGPILQWLQNNPQDCSQVLEKTIELVTQTSRTLNQERQKAVTNYEKLIQSYLEKNPDTNMSFEELTKHTSTDNVEEKDKHDSYGLHFSHRDFQTRTWRNMDGRHCIGRFIPDMRSREGKEQEEQEEKRDFFRGKDVSETEVNLQLGTLTLKASVLQSLDSQVARFSDFNRVFGRNASELQCAEVKITSKRKWLRLLAKRHDLMFWTPDNRSPPIEPYTGPSILSSDSNSMVSIVQEALKPLVSKVSYISEVDWFLSTHQPNPRAILIGGYVRENEIPENGKSSTMLRELREAIVWTHNLSVHVFNVIEHGRRFYRSLVFSSDSSLSLQDMQRFEDSRLLPPSEFGFAVWCDVSQDSELKFHARESLVISRNLGVTEDDEQVFIPSRFMRGLVPAALLEDYEFWQCKDDSLIGVPSQASTIRKSSSSSSCFLIRVKFLGDVGGDVAIIRNLEDNPFSVLSSGSLSMSIPTEYETLLNLQTASPESTLGQLALFLQRIEDLSHCLVWTKSKCLQGDSKCTVDLVELPRLSLSFHVAPAREGGFRLFSHDHMGMFISNRRNEHIGRLFRGISFSILLESVDGELGLLMPAYPPFERDHISPIDSRENAAIRPFVFDRTNREWQNNLQLKHYYYPIHISTSFLFTQTLSSTLYLMLLRFLNQDFREVFQLADACVADADLSSEEEQIFQKLVSMPLIRQNRHPDAHACRLKIFLVASESSLRLKVPWNIDKEMIAYIGKHSHVSAHCRFTISEEMSLLELCSEKNDVLSNRKLVIQGLLSGASKIKLPLHNSLISSNQFDSILDDTCFDVEAPKKFLKASRKAFPDSVGVETIRMIEDWLKTGVTFRQVSYLFIYEAFSCSVIFKILPTDSTYNLGCLLTRCLDFREYSEKSPLMSVLKLFVYNPNLAMSDTLPKFIEKKGGFTLFGASEGLSRFSKELSAWLADRKLSVFWPRQYVSDPRIPKGVCIVELPNLMCLPRTCIVPRVLNFSCSSRELGVMAPINKLGLSESEIEVFSSVPLSPVKLEKFLVETNEYESLSQLDCLPFDLSSHPLMKNVSSQKTVKRFEDDIKVSSEEFRNIKTYTLSGFLVSELLAYVNDPTSFAGSMQAMNVLNALKERVSKIYTFDMAFMSTAMKHVIESANHLGINEASKDLFDSDDSTLKSRMVFALSRYGNSECLVWFEYLVASLMSSRAEKDIQVLNPFLSADQSKRVIDMTSVCLLHANRGGQCRRILAQIDELLRLFDSFLKLKYENEVAQKIAAKDLAVRAQALTQALCSRRSYAVVRERTFEYDPRFLVFEFAQNLLLRKSQVEMVNKFVEAVQDSSRGAMCQQMIMGSGKTTVVAPLLALILADGTSLFVQVVPRSLLEFSRSIIRERFAAIVRKPVYTFDFDRFRQVDPDMLKKLHQSKDCMGIVISHPSAVKALMLKFVELVHEMDCAFVQKSHDSTSVIEIRKQLSVCEEVLSLFKDSILIIDEVDLVLHPLKSELNFPIGIRQPLDFTNKIPGLGKGLRWEVVFIVLDAVLFATEKELSDTVFVAQSKDAETALQEVSCKIEEGISKGYFQRTPHLVLLDRSYYHTEILPLLARWVVIWLSIKPHPGITEKQMLHYLNLNVVQREHQRLGSPSSSSVSVEDGIDVSRLDDDFVKMLNLLYDWLHSFLPFVLGKINRVTFGLLSPAEIAKFMTVDPKMPRSRKYLAVPFVGKDVPSASSEFSHPDIVIGLTVLAYRYEGLRQKEFLLVMKSLQQELFNESGPLENRGASLRFENWVLEAGSTIRGSKRRRKIPKNSSLVLKSFRTTRISKT